MNFKNLKRITFSVGLFLGVVPPTQGYGSIVEFTSGQVSFTAVGQPSALKIQGSGEAMQGTGALERVKMPDGTVATELRGDLQFDLSTLSTGIGMRDRHMKEKYLETSKFSVSNFKLTRFLVPGTLLEEKGDQTVPFEGELALHGVVKKVSGLAQVTRKSKQADANVEFSINLEEFGIQIPSFAGITVAKTVSVKVALHAMLKD